MLRQKDHTANLQDELTGTLISLAAGLGAKPNEEQVRLAMETLFTTITNVNFDDEVLKARIAELKAVFPGESYNMTDIWDAHEDIRSLKTLILLGLRGMAAYAHHAYVLGYQNEEVNEFFFKALAAIAQPDYGMDELLPLVLETAESALSAWSCWMRPTPKLMAHRCPLPFLSPSRRPFIVITGRPCRSQATARADQGQEY